MKNTTIPLKNNLFLVESPFQLACAIEAANKFGSGDVIVRVNSREENQFKELLLFSHEIFNSVIVINNSLSSSYQLIKFLIKLNWMLKNINYEFCFFGEFRSPWMRAIAQKYERRYLIDDGFATINALEVIKGHKKDIKFSKVAKCIYSIVGLNTKLDSKTFLYSIYDDPLIKARNHFDYLKSKSVFNSQSKPIDVVIGSGIVDIDLLDETYYLSKLKELLSLSDRDLFYIPHRNESNEVIKKVEYCGLKIMKLDKPIELSVIMGEVNLRVVYGFFSTVLISLNVISPKVKVKMKFIPEEYMKGKRVADFISVRDYLIKSKVEVI